MTSSPIELPGDYARGAGRSRAWAVRAGELPPVAAGASTQTLLAAWCAVLQKHTGETDLIFGAPGPIRVAVEPDGSFAELVTQVASALAGPPAEVDGAPRIHFWHGAQAPETGQLAVGIVGGALRIGYDSALLEHATADRLATHYGFLLEQALSSPDTPVGALALPPSSTDAPLWTLPAPDSEPAPEPAAGETLAGRFRAVVAAYPDRLAVRGESTSYTYRELDVASDSLAARLRETAGHGDRVALLCAHDARAVIAMWAVLKAGAAYVPLDPRQPAARLADIVADADPAAILCDPELTATAAGLAAERPVLSLTDGVEPGARPPGSAGTDPDALAYILYTSGSTGRPKGVMQSARNVRAHALRYAARLRIGPGDRVPLVARYTFDAAVMDLFGALLSGASLHVLDPYAQPPAALLAELAERQVTLLHCTPTLLRHLLGRGADSAPVPAVRAVVLGGEEVTGADAAAVTRYFPGAALVNGLGPTECTIAVQHLVDPSDAERAAVPIGYPVDGIEVGLVDAAGRPAQVFGELVLTGAEVALGYWNQPDLTAKVFGTRPDGVRYYRSGDLARRRPDGTLVFCGRRDQQVKIRGYRVEPAEAETLLRAHPTVRHAAVVADHRAELGTRLIAYVTSPGPLLAEPNELFGYLCRLLPDYAVPARIVVLERLPIGPTGKLDRSALPAPVEEEPDHDDAPQTPLERRLVDIWCEILHHEKAGVRNNFFASGGDSLDVMELLDRISDDFGVDVSLPVFLSAPTVETLAKCVDAATSTR